MLAGMKVKILLTSGLIMSLFGLVQPAAGAQSQTPHSICNGVVNQLQQRGVVEQRLLEAAARQNAELLQQLEAERALLQNERQQLEQQIEQLEQELAQVEAEIQQLEAEIQQVEDELAQVEAEIQQLERRIQLAGCV